MKLQSPEGLEKAAENTRMLEQMNIVDQPLSVIPASNVPEFGIGVTQKGIAKMVQEKDLNQQWVFQLEAIMQLDAII